MVEGARLEIVWAEMSRRFESSRFRQDKAAGRVVFLMYILFEQEYVTREKVGYSLPLPVKTMAKVLRRILISLATLQWSM